MAPSATPEGESATANSQKPVKSDTPNGIGQSKDVPESESKSSKASKQKNVNGSQKAFQDAEGQKEAKLSGKELKEKAKAEKAAKRAREKQGHQGQPVADLQVGNPAVERQRRGSMTSKAPTPAIGTHHKRTGSVTAGQKSLPIRSAELQAVKEQKEPEKEDKNVALFGHLYGNPRRTTIAGAGKDVHPAVLALGLQMSNYVICGSNARCVATLLVFKRVIESYITPSQNSLPRHLTTHLSAQIDYLVSCRPLSISMGNAIRWLKVSISEIDVSTPESDAKDALCDSINNFIRERITVADQVIATSAASKIQNGDTILTYAKSSIVQQTLAEAHRQGKTFRVVVVDSRPLFEGKNLARALADLGLKVQYTLTHALNHAINPVTKVLLGAHAMLSNGRLYSRIGTALVAMTAKEHKIPVIVCCESVKFTDRVALDSFVHNEIAPPEELLREDRNDSTVSQTAPLAKWRDVPRVQLLNLMYDLTPAECIDMVITEYGSLPPSSVPVVHRLSTNS